MTELQKQYNTQIIPLMKEKFGYKNINEVSRIVKVVLNVGAGKALKDPKIIDIMIDNLRRVTGQAPVKTRAIKSISGFGVKEGQVVGLVVTLRGWRMYEFLNKFINVVLPRFRDFQGLSPEAFDGHGNYNIGVKEQIVFPEIKADEIEKIHGVEITVATTAKTDEEGLELLRAFGFLFRKRGERAKEEELKEVSKKEAVLKRYETMKKLQKNAEVVAKPASAAPKTEEKKTS